MKKQWAIMTIATDSGKAEKVLQVWCCVVLHNMLQRYRIKLAALSDPEFQRVQDEFTELLRTVDAEIDRERGDVSQAAQEAAQDRSSRKEARSKLSDATMKTAGKALRESLTAELLGSTNGVCRTARRNVQTAGQQRRCPVQSVEISVNPDDGIPPPQTASV